MGHVVHSVTHAVSHAAHSVAHAVARPIQVAKEVVQHPWQAINHPTETITRSLPGTVQHIVQPFVKPVEHLEAAVNTKILHPIATAFHNLGNPQPIEPTESQAPTTLDAAPAIAAAPNVAVPGQEAGAEEETTSGKRKSARSGKKSLTVARNTGGGVNV